MLAYTAMDRASEKNLIHVELGNATLAFGPPRTINFHTKRDVAMHVHSIFELHTLYDGQARIETERNRYLLTAGNIALIPPNVYHSIANVTDSFSLRSFSFSLHIAETRHSDAQFDVHRLMRLIRQEDVVILEDSSAIMWIVEHLVDEIDSDSLLGAHHMRESYSIALLVMLVRKLFAQQAIADAPQRREDTPNSFFDPVRAYEIETYLAANYLEGNIQELARTLALSEQHVRRILLANYGMPFSQLMNKHRVNVCKQLLRETEMSVTDIWQAAGFNTPQSFTNAFRRYSDCTPTQYRKKHRGMV